MGKEHAVIYQGRHPVRGIVMHYALTPRGWNAGWSGAQVRDEVRRWHRDRGWRDIGYHWVIAWNGSIAPGRAENVLGAHVGGGNSGTIGIMLVGGMGTPEGAFLNHHSAAQQTAAVRLIREIMGRTGRVWVKGHRDLGASLCPGYDAAAWWAAQSGSPAPVETTRPMPAMPTLRLTSPWTRGEAVRAVQERVGTSPDGVFGPATDRAVRAFQGREGLTVDGIVGPQTWSALHDLRPLA